MRFALGQINPTVGDIVGNTRLMLEAIAAAKSAQADLVIFPELSVLGYPPRDLLLKPSLITQQEEALSIVAEACRGIAALVGYAEPNSSKDGRKLFNAAALVADGKILARRHKSLLPTYDVFDEARYFEPGPVGEITAFSDRRLGISICEDLWNDEQFLERTLYHMNPIAGLAGAGAEVLINISASPFVVGKNEFRRKLFGHQARRWKMPIVYVNQVGGNDELLFDGNSCVFGIDGKVIAHAADFAEDLLIVDVPVGSETSGAAAEKKSVSVSIGSGPERAPAREGIASIHAALVLGLRDYARKCGFKSCVLGLSGGIDSAVVAALAVEAVGAANVLGVSLPSRYSSDHSKSDAQILAERLGVKFETIAIEPIHRAMEGAVEPLFHGLPPGLAEENMQARIRGNVLMSLSNKFGHLLLTTGNKSEVATGYCTLYGDMCGGLAVISDVPKMMVYELARHLNREAEALGKPAPIPEGTLTKPPSAELRPNQKDQDSLPPYDVLDAIIFRYVEEEKSTWQIIGEGFDQETVLRIARLIDLNEYKRKQMAPGLKVTSRAFGFGRRMPIAQRYDQRLMSIRPAFERRS
jgi:NAD+ synthase (glutamine-hydrolysing)